MKTEYIWEIIEEYFGRIIGVVLGLIVALIFILFGFWQGMLMIILIIAGFYLGLRWDQEGRLPISIDKLLPPKR